ncbi:Protein fam13b [Cichlidogyrus casuarinus]|uniref:Protein fam13b n=1 Tax=Cichlidogyrus casuarinus TaxID=1844966 RepID=A0ABD2QEJ5_9PLAT
MKNQFEVSCASELTEEVEGQDMHNISGVLKLFLRELADGVVPERYTSEFAKTTSNYRDHSELCVEKLKRLLRTLPPANLNTLAYLVGFLFKVAEKEKLNKMSPDALGIIFGPCIFRCSIDSVGIKNQAISNFLMTLFIQNFEQIFLCPADKNNLQIDKFSGDSTSFSNLSNLDSDKLGSSDSRDRLMLMHFSSSCSLLKPNLRRESCHSDCLSIPPELHYFAFDKSVHKSRGRTSSLKVTELGTTCTSSRSSREDSPCSNSLSLGKNATHSLSTSNLPQQEKTSGPEQLAFDIANIITSVPGTFHDQEATRVSSNDSRKISSALSIIGPETALEAPDEDESLDICIRIASDNLMTKARDLTREDSATYRNEPYTSGCAPQNRTDEKHPPLMATQVEFRDLLLAALTEQRSRCDRPEELDKMNKDQIQKEKLDLQKGLLYFEKLYGHPNNLNAKRIMRPLYNRYRLVKQMAKASQINDSSSAVLVDQDLDSSFTNSALFINQIEKESSSSITPARLSNSEEDLSGYASRLLDLSPVQIKSERDSVLKFKLKLQRILRDFETEKQELEGRRPDKKERDQMRSQYNQYRKLKKKLAVIDTLLTSSSQDLSRMSSDKTTAVTALMISAQLSPLKSRNIRSDAKPSRGVSNNNILVQDKPNRRTSEQIT